MSEYSKCIQKVYINIVVDENISDERLIEISEDIVINEVINDELNNILSRLFTNGELQEVEYMDNNVIEVNFLARVGIIDIIPGYAGSRYQPPEPDEIKWDYSDLAPTKYIESDYNLNKVKRELLDLFEEKGWTEITDITKIYGEDDLDNQLNSNYY